MGGIETHFHVFGSLAFLSFYRDWRVLIPATAVVAIDHMVRGIFYPQSVFGVLAPDDWRWVEHAAWVLFEDVFLVISCIRSQKEMRQIALDTAMLDASEARYRNVTDSASDAILTIDELGVILFVNQSAEKMFGYAAEELIGQEILALVPDDARRRQRLLLKRYVTRKQSISAQVVEVPTRHKDGHDFLTETSFADYNSDRGRIFTAVVRDITLPQTRRRSDQAE